MSIQLVRLDPAGADREALTDFLVGSEWPFHVGARRTPEDVAAAIDDGAYRDEDHDTYWLEHEELGRVGIIRFEDLSEGAPLFDLRLADGVRGRGIGREALAAATEFVFRTMPDVDRFEGQTREDNVAMLRTFQLSPGWVKEAHYRHGWPVEGGEPRASVAYAILRQDWERGTVTPVPWEDGPVVIPAS